MSLNYTTYTSQIAGLLTYATSDPIFTGMQPGMIDYAEERLYADMDLLATRIVSSGTVSANQRTLSYPTQNGTYLVIENIAIITPAGTPASSGTRTPLRVASIPFINTVYPSNYSGTGAPTYFAPLTSTSAVIAPVPDQAYDIEVIGTYRPAALSSANSSTVLTQYFPALFIAASMVYGTGFQRDFGAQSDNPATAQSWETQYKNLFNGTNIEEFRKKYQSQGWQNQIPSPVATPPRV